MIDHTGEIMGQTTNGIYSDIRRPRQTQGGARQGIILLTLVSDYYYYSSSTTTTPPLLLLLWVSEVTLGIFGVQFWGFSVLQRHGVSPPGGDCFEAVLLLAAAGNRISRKMLFF